MMKKEVNLHFNSTSRGPGKVVENLAKGLIENGWSAYANNTPRKDVYQGCLQEVHAIGALEKSTPIIVNGPHNFVYSKIIKPGTNNIPLIESFSTIYTNDSSINFLSTYANKGGRGENDRGGGGGGGAGGAGVNASNGNTSGGAGGTGILIGIDARPPRGGNSGGAIQSRRGCGARV